MTFVDSGPTSSTSVPIFDYSSRDYAAVYADLVNRIPIYLPEWTSTSPNDFGQVLLQMFAYTVDLQSYYLDRLAGEAFIQTATQPSSILNLASMLDYQPGLSTGATITNGVEVTISSAIVGPVTFPVGTQFQTVASSTSPAIVFETTEELVIAGANAATPSVYGFVSVVQGVTQSNEAVGTSTGAINQIFSLLYNPVSAGSYSVYVDIGLGPQLWTNPTGNTLVNSGPTDQVYSTFVDANGIFYIVFGDGVNGYVPPLGSPITCTYQTNSGSQGNVGVGTIVQAVSATPGYLNNSTAVGISSVTNTVAATGGSSAESLTSIQQNAPASLKTLTRAVTIDDFQTLAVQASSAVLWASAVEETYQLVNLYICPTGGTSPTVPSSLEDVIQQFMSGVVMANTTVTILSPTYVGVNVTASVTALSNYSNTTVQANVIAALADLLALSNTGFGFRVSLGLIYSTILDIAGVDWANVTALNREMLVPITANINSGSGITTISTTALPQTVNSGDTLILTSLSSSGAVLATQTLSANAQANAGSASVSVTSATANANYPLYAGSNAYPNGYGSILQDTTALADCVFFANEIPIAGTFTITVTGGVVGS